MTPINHSIETASKPSLMKALYQHAQVSTTRELKQWVLTHYSSEDLPIEQDEHGQPIATLAGWAHNLKHRSVGFRKRKHIIQLFQLLDADPSGLEQRQHQNKNKRNPKRTWPLMVRKTVHWIADHGVAAKTAVDQLPDEHLKFTSLKSFTTFSEHLQLQVNSHSDDPTQTLKAELCQLVGVHSETDLKAWIKANFQGDSSALDTWDFNDHQTLISVQRMINDIQQQTPV